MAVLVHLTDAAWLRGFRQLARGSGTSVNTFLGIPYATPPIGELRFSLTKPAELWTGERDATNLGTKIISIIKHFKLSNILLT